MSISQPALPLPLSPVAIDLAVRASANPPGHPGPFRLCVLGSGSGGNCTVIQSGTTFVALDMGLGPRVTAHRLEQIGLKVSDLSAVILTHLDQDHFRPVWAPLLLEARVPIHLSRWHHQDILVHPHADALGRAGLLRLFDGRSFELDPAINLRVHPVRLPHDRQGTVGYRLDHPHGRIGYATDLGRVPNELINLFTGDGGLSILAIESNYDPVMLRTSARPRFLKERITGGAGHLSNQQAFEAVRKIAKFTPTGGPAKVVLLHRSAQCNCPEIVKRTFDQDPAIARRIALTQQNRRSPWFEAPTSTPPQSVQLTLGF